MEYKFGLKGFYEEKKGPLIPFGVKDEKSNLTVEYQWLNPNDNSLLFLILEEEPWIPRYFKMAPLRSDITNTDNTLWFKVLLVGANITKVVWIPNSFLKRITWF